MSELSPTTRSLLRAAREDGPSAASRAQMWNGVAANMAGGAVLGTAGAGKAAASAATAKLFVMGALLGCAVTVGVAAMVLGVGAPRLHPDPAVVVGADTDTDNLSPAALAPPATPRPALPSEATRGAKRSLRAHATNDDELAREAELVAEARGAVMRGEAATALNALRAAMALPAHAMEPEELSLEVRALRELGRLDDANAVDARLRAKFPDHALAR